MALGWVRFTLRSGKAIGRKRREIMVTFRHAARVPAGLKGAAPHVLHLALVPDPISMELNVNGPGDPVLRAWRASRVPMSEYAAGTDGPDAWRTTSDIGLVPISGPEEPTRRDS